MLEAICRPRPETKNMVVGKYYLSRLLEDVRQKHVNRQAEQPPETAAISLEDLGKQIAELERCIETQVTSRFANLAYKAAKNAQNKGLRGGTAGLTVR